MIVGGSFARNATRCWAILLLAAIAGCATAPARISSSDTSGTVTRSAPELASVYPVAANENIRPVMLGRTESLSYHFIQIRDRETPHVHATHDLVVTLLGGQGTLHLEDRSLAMKAGDTAVIQRGQRHFFVNMGDRPAAAFVTFAPPYDGSDNVPVD